MGGSRRRGAFDIVARGLFASVTVWVALLTMLLSGAAQRWAERRLAIGEPVPVFGEVFRLTRGENTGIAFSLLRDSPVVPWLSALALGVVAVYLARGLHQWPAGGVAVGLILGGGGANLLDRLGDGRVTDYLDWGIGGWRYATFNLPDTAIVCGLALALLWRATAMLPTQSLVQRREESA